VRAIVMRAHGGPEVLVEEDWPTPEPAPGEALVRVLGASLNRADLFGRVGHAAPHVHRPRLPHIPGVDGAGEVVATGDPADAGWVGKRVVIYGAVLCGKCAACTQGDAMLCERYALVGEHLPGTLAQYVTVPVPNLVPISPTGDPVAAACLPAAYTTAWNMLEAGGARPGSWVAVVGASGGVGVAGLQLARLFGAFTVAITSSPEKAERLRALGADQVVVAPRQAFAAPVLALRPRGVDLALNPVGGATWHDSVEILARGGALALCGATDGDAPTISVRQIYQLRRRVVGAPLGPIRQLQRIADLYDAGRLEPAVDRVFPLEQVAEAHRYMEAGAFVGKVAIRVGGQA
jgi:NADPH:quinone reductase-like Zn-dependent oxidoreductase